MMDYLAEKLKVRKPLLYLLILLIIVASYNFFIKKEISHIQETKEKITQLENELTLVGKKIKGINANKLKEMEHRTWEFKKQYDLGLESQLVLLDASKYAEKANLNIIGFQSQDKVDLEEFKHREYSLAFIGDYAEFLYWLRQMEEMPYYINIKDLYIGKYLISQENKKWKRPSEELVFQVTINNIALEGDITWETVDPNNFRPEPFEPGILNKK
ncbi:MAG: Pilus assembly protein PilO [Clostridia bacterium]|jgi:Tfp pilus assembly protein PilO|nr:Pilus assembly protein PilO [Clostridia bacterium]MDN5323704.1 Pilus assembly protein PilO [Clostridia bacterium]